MAESAVFCVIQSLGKLKLSEARFSPSTRDQLKKIELKLRRLQDISKIADARQHEDEWIRDWVAKTRKVAYDAEELLDIFDIEFSLRSEQSFLRRPSEKKLKTLHDIESKISSQETNWKVCTIGSTGEGEIPNSVSERRQETRRTYSHHEVEFVGLDEDIEKLVAHVVPENGNNCCHVVSIIGKGGIGKTALARRVYHHEHVRGYFNAFAWATISRQWQPEEVLQRILCKLVPEESEKFSTMENLIELINKLNEVQKEIKCLVVLDDVCDTDVWTHLRSAFPNRNLVSKLVLTTRNKEIACRIDTDTSCYPYEQRHLNDEESWELLQRKVFPFINIADATSSSGSFGSCRSVEEEDGVLDNLDTPHSEDETEDIGANTTDEIAAMEEIGKVMVRQCGGLPLAIILLGGILMKKLKLREWEKMHESCNSYFRERFRENDKVYEMLALSYHDLPYQTKQCFWHLGNFPKYHSIPTRKLYQLWVAEGFILSGSNAGEEESSTDIAQRHLCELEQRCMVQVHVEESTGRLKFCQLHDFVREICTLKGEEEDFQKKIPLPQESEFSVSSPSSSEATSSTMSSATCSRIVYKGSAPELSLTSEQDNPENVRSAMFFSKPEEQKNNLQTTVKLLSNSYRLLRVLDLERFDFGEELSESIGNLVHLRYLSLRGSTFNRLPSSIGNLRFLQTLDLRVSYDSFLIIPNVLCKLIHLRHLYLPPRQSITNKVQLGSLRFLEILKNFDPRVSDFSDIPKLSKLRKLTVIFYFEAKSLNSINEHLGTKCKRLNESSFRILYNFTTGKDMNLLQQLVGCVHLRKLDLIGQIEKLPQHYQFSQHLTKLTLRSSALMEDPLAILEKLPNLLSLTLRANAYVGCRLCCSAGGFRQLRTIEFQGLASLERWIIEEGAMPNILHITIDKCTELNMLPEGIRSLSNIRELVIADMPDAFNQTFKTDNHSYKVTIIGTHQGSTTKSRINQGSTTQSEHRRGSRRYRFHRSFTASLVPRTW